MKLTEDQKVCLYNIMVTLRSVADGDEDVDGQPIKEIAENDIGYLKDMFGLE
jgi:ABC-type uncharacterized transport system ATPase subunit